MRRTVMKWAALAAALLILVIFPGLASLVAVPAAGLVVWVSAQPVLVGVVVGILARPRLRRSGSTPRPGGGRA